MPRQKDIIEESDLSPDLIPVSSAPVIPGEQGRVGVSAPPPFVATPPQLGNYFEGSLPSDMQRDGNFIKTGYQSPQAASYPLMPVAVPPSQNAAAQSVAQIVVEEAISNIVFPTSGLRWRGTWSATNVYSVNDIVVYNRSTYIAIVTNSQVTPPTDTTKWTLVGENFNYRGYFQGFQTLQSKQKSGVLAAVAATFDDATVAGNTIIAIVNVFNRNNGVGDTVTDSQGNTYTLVVKKQYTSASVIACAIYVAANIVGGANTVTSTLSPGTGPGTHVLTIVEVPYLDVANVIEDFDSSEEGPAYAGATAPSPALSLTTAVNNNLIIVTGQITNAGSITPTQPAGYTNISQSIGTTPWLIAYSFDTTAGAQSLAISYSPALTNASEGVFAAASFNIDTTLGALYNPFDLVQWRGSAYVCIVATSQSPDDEPASWQLFAQGAGGVNPITGNYTASVDDQGRLVTHTSGTGHTLTLPVIPPNNGWWVAIHNVGTGTLTIDPQTNTIDGSSTDISLVTNQGVIIYTDGTVYYQFRGFGTVFSVALSMPSIFSVAGSPITGSGTFTVTLVNKNANTIFAGPASGAAAAPTFRSMVGADIPRTYSIMADWFFAGH